MINLIRLIEIIFIKPEDLSISRHKLFLSLFTSYFLLFT